MQNIPGITSDSTADQYKALKLTVTTTTSTDKQSMFEELFQMHSSKVEHDLALSPIATTDKMVASAPEAAESVAQDGTAQTSVAQSGQAKETKSTASKTTAKEDKEPAQDKRDQRMTQDDFNKVKEDLKEYGLSDKEIAELEKKVNSDEGLTWNQFVSALAEKMAELRKVALSDAQKADLTSFFSKLGFSEKQSARLLSQVENGETDKVMTALKAKLESMSDGKQLLLTKDEVDAFASAMQFSKELTGKLEELLGQGGTGKGMKQAFAMLGKEMAALDAKDEKLVKAVGKAFAEATGKEVKETSVAKDIQEAVDLKPRTADDNGADTMVKEDLKEALEERRDTMPESNAKKAAATKTLPKQAEGQAEPREQKTEDESDKNWRDFFGKLRDDASASVRQTQAKAENAEQALNAALTDTSAKAKTQAWEKVTAPKVMRQVENAVIKTLSNGAKQLTLQLAPENLGKLSVALQVHGKEVSAVIRAESSEAAKLIHENLDVIKQALQDQGLKVDKLDVQSGLTGNYSDSNWFGQEQHNLAREREVMTAMRNHMRAMRGETGTATDAAQAVVPTVQTDGLHIVA
ncbi:flagellar hook-length control protein FliK [Pseudodesulfovibrio sp.]|uniref:flagellar hook-length control protein FliK n=1 Tax=Pseudodesulfovibrio sp. TaxID=2035812 RepID=UPI002639543B|nr:flagellar hook-length control protein FliK [Pseudodesulfovibrio sp.]MDD3312282.1 flagellar hook-length control protein FliK [Pseudodesulfovibrio sp.]